MILATAMQKTAISESHDSQDTAVSESPGSQDKAVCK